MNVVHFPHTNDGLHPRKSYGKHDIMKNKQAELLLSIYYSNLTSKVVKNRLVLPQVGVKRAHPSPGHSRQQRRSVKHI